MRPGRSVHCPVILAALLMVHWVAAPAGATGYWNVPSTFCQCVGCGWGAGYHAPLVLGPITCGGWCDPNEVRLPYSPAAAYGCYSSGDGGCNCGQPSRLEAAVVRPPVHAPGPVPELSPVSESVPVSAIFAPPIER